jgi:Domain of unknown function (DUF5979)
VTKNIAGDGAGQQGEISILVACGGPANNFAFIIPAGQAAGAVKRSFDNLPAGSVCTVTETADGHTSSAPVVVSGSGQTVTVAANATATANLTDTYGTVAASTTTAVAAAAAQTAATLPATGAAPATPTLIEFGAAAVGTGAVLLAVGGRGRYQRRHARHRKP